MEENIKNSNAKKNIILSLVICAFGLLLVGGTYAYFTMNFDATNSSIVTDTRCFSVNYTDNTDQITGVLWPSANDGGGLSGSVTVQANSTCGVNGNGKLYLNVDSSSSEELTTSYTDYYRGYCLNKYTLEKTELIAASCNVSENYIWVNTRTILKYAIYDSPARTNLYASGFIDESFVGTDKEILSDFSIDSTAKTFYIYIWMDGNLTGDTGNGDYSFSAQIKTGATQVTSEAREYPGDNYVVINNDIYTSSTWQDVYQLVEYIESTGTQYINTGIDVFNGKWHSIDSSLMFTSFVNNNIIYGYSTGNGAYKSWADSSGKWKAIYNNVSYGDDIQLSLNSNHIMYLYGSYYDDRDEMSVGKEFYTNGNWDDPYYDYIDAYNKLDGELYLFYDGTNYGKYRLYGFCFNMDDYDSNYANHRRLSWCGNPVYRKSDNVAGLLDYYNGLFYPNSGTGNFVVGPDIDRDYLRDYVY